MVLEKGQHLNTTIITILLQTAKCESRGKIM